MWSPATLRDPQGRAKHLDRANRRVPGLAFFTTDGAAEAVDRLATHAGNRLSLADAARKPGGLLLGLIERSVARPRPSGRSCNSVPTTIYST